MTLKKSTPKRSRRRHRLLAPENETQPTATDSPGDSPQDSPEASTGDESPPAPRSRTAATEDAKPAPRKKAARRPAGATRRKTATKKPAKRRTAPKSAAKGATRKAAPKALEDAPAAEGGGGEKAKAKTAAAPARTRRAGARKAAPRTAKKKAAASRPKPAAHEPDTGEGAGRPVAVEAGTRREAASRAGAPAPRSRVRSSRSARVESTAREAPTTPRGTSRKGSSSRAVPAARPTSRPTARTSSVRGRAREGAPSRVQAPRKGARVMLINAAEPEECRIAILEGGRVEEYYIDRSADQDIVHNIYKGRVVNVEPAIQAAFVDIGSGRNGFLHVSDVMPAYETCKDISRVNTSGISARPRGTPDIRKLLRKGDEVLVQISKNEIGKKGPTLTTYLSIPGRYLVLMPGLAKRGVSSKIRDRGDRLRLRRAVESIKTRDKIGFIVRTASTEDIQGGLERDHRYLMKLWDAIVLRAGRPSPPGVVYLESDLVIRTIRDLLNPSISGVIIDNEPVFERAKEFVHALIPESEDLLALYNEDMPLFHRHGVEAQLETFYERRVQLKSGAFLVIDETEALVAIDVNSGRYTRERDPNKLALTVNSEAVPEIARQLRVRDLGGLVVVDFIDLADEKDRRTISDMLRDEFRQDRARFNMTEMSEFGLVEITRQRFRGGLERLNFNECPACHGKGLVRTVESEALASLRRLRFTLGSKRVAEVRVTAPPPVATYLNNVKRREILEMEDRSSKRIFIISGSDTLTETQIILYDDNSREVTLER